MTGHKNTVLILGRREDMCCRLVDEALRERGSRALFLPEDQLLPGLQFTWRPGMADRGHVAFGDAELHMDSVVGVLSRSYGVIHPEDFETPDGQYISAEWHALLMAWLHALPCTTVVNRLKPSLWYRVRLDVPDLLALIPDLAFNVPRSLVTTRADEARSFCQSVDGPVRFSPLTQSSRYRIASEKDRSRLESLAGTLPLYLSEWIDGSPFDAIVVGQNVLLLDAAGELSSRPGDHLRDRCLEMASALDLAFCRLSLVQHGEEWFCLELDRLPRLELAAHAAQTTIAANLATLLAGTASP